MCWDCRITRRSVIGAPGETHAKKTSPNGWSGVGSGHCSERKAILKVAIVSRYYPPLFGFILTGGVFTELSDTRNSAACKSLGDMSFLLQCPTRIRRHALAHCWVKRRDVQPVRGVLYEAWRRLWLPLVEVVGGGKQAQRTSSLHTVRRTKITQVRRPLKGAPNFQNEFVSCERCQILPWPILVRLAAPGKQF